MCARLPVKQRAMRLIIKRRSRDGRTGVHLFTVSTAFLNTGRTGVARVSGGVVERPLHFRRYLSVTFPHALSHLTQRSVGPAVAIQTIVANCAYEHTKNKSITNAEASTPAARIITMQNRKATLIMLFSFLLRACSGTHLYTCWSVAA